MQQFLNVWSALSPRKRILVALASIAVFASVLGIGRMAATPQLTLLYSGLEARAAGEVVQALQQQGVAHEVRGGAIYVDAAARDALRMTLASEGLPASNAQGYEILDSLTGFGTTSQMFDAAYWRAKEGELARTILSIPNVRAARVHIASTGSNPFLREIRPSASVTVTIAGASLSVTQARAIKSLVSSAVASLSPEDVTIIDSVAGLIGGADEDQSISPGTDRSDALRERVLRLLEARVGVGNAMVEVNITTDTAAETIRERIVNPESRVAISTDSEESNTDATNAQGGTVTVASNLPDGDAASENESRSTNTLSRERVNYEMSETSREVMRAAGDVKRITVAVLVNGIEEIGADGRPVLQPRPDDELQALSDLVSSTVGLNEDRGDVVTIKSMNFLQTEPAGTMVTSSVLQNLAFDAMSLIQLAVLAIVALVLGLFVLRPILSGSASDSSLKSAAELAALGIAKPSLGSENLIPLTGEIADDTYVFPSTSGAAVEAITGQPDSPRTATEPVERLRQLIAERQDETVEILRGWLDDRGERA